VQLYATSGESEIAWKEGKIIFRNSGNSGSISQNCRLPHSWLI
jgi:hypothetical protein